MVEGGVNWGPRGRKGCVWMNTVPRDLRCTLRHPNQKGLRGCTLGGNFEFLKGRKSVIWGIWEAPGAPETLQKTTHFQKKSGVCWPCQKAARPKKHVFTENVWFVGLGARGLQKSTWPKKHFGIPLSLCWPSLRAKGKGEQAEYTSNHTRTGQYPMLRNSASGPELGLPGRNSARF